MVVTVHVTQEHVSGGVIRDCHRCPIALALQERFPHLTAVNVGTSYLILWKRDWYGRDVRLDVKTPAVALRFMNTFDSVYTRDRNTLPSFAFEIDVPEEWVHADQT